MSKPTLLINLSIAKESTTQNFVMPIGILSLISYLISQGEHVDFIDLNVDKDVDKRLNEEPEIVGLSVMVAGQFNQAYEICKKIKQRNTKTLTVMGGAHVSQFSKDIKKNCKEVDFVIEGEGENKLLNLIRNGLVNQAAYIKDLDNLPWPAYHLLNFKDYRRDYSTWNNPYNADLGIRVPIITSRGCPKGCNFCSVKNHMGTKYRYMNSYNVVNLLQWLHEKYGVIYFAFYDANFSCKPNRIIEICNEIKRRGLKFYLDLPTGIPIDRFAIPLIEALVEVGLIRITLSVESGDSVIRNKVMKKHSNQNDIFAIIDAIHKYKHLYLLTDFIIGMPEDTAGSLNNTCDLVSSLNVDDITISIATPYPGTPLYDQCVKDNLFLPEINPQDFYKDEEYSHSNINRFTIKPYAMTREELIFYRDKMLSLKERKLCTTKT